jgi:hypothetical protein
MASDPQGFEAFLFADDVAAEIHREGIAAIRNLNGAGNHSCKSVQRGSPLIV